MKTALFAVCIFYALATNAATYYFSSNSGNDTYSNLLAQNPLTPWQTLTKFNSIFASLQPGDSVLFKRGDTFYGTLTISRSGTAALPIIIGAYGTGAKPVITGFSTISAWTVLGGGIYESTLAITSLTSLNMVTFQDTLQPMGRWPKATASNGGYLTFQTHSGTTSLTSDAIASALNYIGGELVIRKKAWIIDRARITNQTSTVVSYQPFVSPSHPTVTDDPIDGNGFFFQNHVNACNILGEWAFDPATKKIKMYFGGGSPNSYAIKATNLESLVAIDSRSYIRFDNLQFIGSNSKTFNISTSNNIQINSCDIRFSGINGVWVLGNDQSNNMQVYNCTISYSNNNAIYADASTNWTIQSNVIRNTGMIRGMGQSGDEQYIAISDVSDNSLVEYNVIKNTGYIGISFKGNSILIKNNFIDSFCRVKSDGGGIYTYLEATKTNRKIISNIVLNGIGDRYGLGLDLTNPYNGATQGIYMDGGSRNVEIDGNTVANCLTGLLLQSSVGIQVRNNTFYNNTLNQIDYASDNNALSNLTVTNNILFAKQDDQILSKIRLTSNYLTTLGTINNNYYCRPIYEPTGINTVGYSHGADWTFPYNDGGINEVRLGAAAWRFYSLDTWQTLSNQDASTVKTSVTVSDVSKIRFEYNATSINKVVPLDATYKTVYGTVYTGSATLAPYTSIILLETIAGPNQSPLANAGNDINLTLPTIIANLNGSATDPDGTIASYSWSRVSGPTIFSITNLTSAITTVTGLIEGTYVFRLTATDNDGATDTDDVSVTVNPLLNQSPTANAGNDITLTLPANSTTLTGSGSDPDGTIATNVWSRVSGPTAYTLGNANSATTTLSDLAAGTYVFRLTVTDNSGDTATADVTVTINVASNQAPTANAGSDINLTLPTILANLNGSATDPDGTIASYSWSRVSGPTAFSITNLTSAITTVIGLIEGTYVFRLTVTDDDGATDTDDVSVTVNPLLNQSPTANAGNDITLALPTNSTTLTGSGSDPDGTIASNVWSRVSGPATYTLGDANSATTALSNLVAGTYVFRLTVTDNNGTNATDDITVTVNAAPQPPIADAGSDITLTLPVNSTTLTGSGSDPDGPITSYAWSSVSGPATFTLGSANAATTTLSNLVQGTYVFRLTVTDNSGATATDDVTVTVNAAPNQAPAANAGSNITLTLPTNSTTLTGSASDPDGTIASYAWSRLSGPTTFTLGSANTASTTLSNLVLGTYVFRLTVTDNSGATATDDVTITVNAAPNQTPTANAGNNIVLTLPTSSTTLSGSGSDPDGTIASYAWSRVSGPTTFTLGSANAASTTLSNLVQGSYVFRLTVTDNGGATATDDVTVTVNAAPNQAPTANAGTNIVLTLPTSSTTLSGSGSDPDGTIASYAWSRVSGPTTFALGSANASSTILNNLVQGTYVFRLTVTDNSGATATDDLTVTVNAAPNQAPTANAGNNIVLTLPTNSTTLTGSGSDPDGTISSYAWSRVSGPTTFTLGSANAASTTLSNLVLGTYVFRLTVTDNSGATATDDVTITVNAAPNQAPTANAGSNIVLTLPTNSTTLTGSGADPDGTIASYTWSRVSGPTTFTLGNANAASTTLSNLVQGTYTFRLTVTDNSGATDFDDMTVIVNAAPVSNQAPIANAGNNVVLTLPTNSTTLTGSGTDADGTISSYAWSRVSGPTTFTLGNANAASTTLSYLVQGTYTFRLTVTDNSGATATGDVTVTVNAAPNQAPTANAGSNIVLTLPTNSTTLTGSGSDPDGTIASYIWSRVSGPTTFTFGNANAASTTLSNLVQGTYTFRLTVTDNSGATDFDNITVTVNAAALPNQAPIANAGSNIVLTLPANSTTLTGSGTDADGTIANYAWSRVSGPTTFTLGNANAASTTLSNLVQGTYVFRLTVTDDDGATDTDDVSVTVNAAPNQAPTANAGNNIVLTLPTNSTTLNGNGSDPDGTIASYAWSRVSGPTTFTLGSANAASTTLNSLVQGTYVFRLTVTDNSGATGTDDITVTVNGAPNQAPTANAGSNIVLTLPTNSTTLTGSGTDADGTISSYAWSRVSGPTTFTLGSANAASTTLNNLVQGTYVFRLTVTDNSGATATDDLTVTVNAAPNQAPTANAGNNIILTLPTNSTTLTGSGSDPDGTISSYAWSRVSGPTTFTLGSVNAASTALNNLVQGTYVFRLTVTDNSGTTATDDIIVTVNAVPNQAPTANAGSNIVLTLPTNSTTLTGSGSDPDGTIASYAWSRVSGPTTFTLGNANAASTTLSNLVQGTYTFRLTVTDNSGATDVDNMTVTVNAAPVSNQAPIANAGNNIVISLPVNSITLNGSSSTDPDGTITTYAWSRVSGPTTFTLGNANAASTTLSNLVQGTYTFRLTVTDNSGATDSDNMTVTVNAAPNQIPAANAGNNIVITLPVNSTILTGSGSDLDGTISTYRWSRVSGPTTFTFANVNAASTALNNLVQGTYVFRLTVTDNGGATATDDVIVTVNAAPIANQAPTARAGNDIVITLPTNFATLNGNTSTDADGTIVSYSWSRVSGPTTFTFTSAGSTATGLNNLVQGTYVFRLIVTDDDGTADTDNITVTVNAAPNQAPIANAGNDIVLTLPTNSTTLSGSGTDADGTIANYAWSRVSGPTTFTFGSANAATTTLSNLVQGTYVFRLTVTDNRGATALDNVTVTVNAAAPVPNQPPVADAGLDQTIALPSNSTTLYGNTSYDPDGTISSYRWQQMSGPATSTFSSTTAAIITLSDLQEGSYTFRLIVRDNRNAADTATVNVTVLNNFRIYGPVALYPNPANDVINVVLNNDSSGTVRFNIYDMQGRQMMPSLEIDKPRGLFTAMINVAQLRPGTYTLEAIANKYIKMVSKFVKM